jgi:hypothetical protein
MATAVAMLLILFFMTIKEKAIAFCKEILQEWQMQQYFNYTLFIEAFNTSFFSGCNAYQIGVFAADYIFKHSKFISNDTE